MRRRDFATLCAGAAATAMLTPRAARSQDGRVRRVGWLIDREENDLLADRTALREALARLGWVEDRNLRIETRFGARDLKRIHEVAAELVSLAPEVIVANGGVAIEELQRQTNTIPIVFTGGPEGIFQNITVPEANITGFPTFEPSVLGKWVALLKQTAPRVARIGVVFNAQTLDNKSGFINMSGFIETAASALGMAVSNLRVRSSVDSVRVIDAFAAEPNGGLVVMPPPPNIAIRDTIIDLTAQHRLPSIWGYRDQAAAGGLMSYGSQRADRFRGVAIYVDRVLRGAKVSELPDQFPTRYQLVLNLKTAKTLGLTLPEALLATADEVIE